MHMMEGDDTWKHGSRSPVEFGREAVLNSTWPRASSSFRRARSRSLLLSRGFSRLLEGPTFTKADRRMTTIGSHRGRACHWGQDPLLRELDRSTDRPTLIGCWRPLYGGAQRTTRSPSRRLGRPASTYTGGYICTPTGGSNQNQATPCMKAKAYPWPRSTLPHPHPTDSPRAGSARSGIRSIKQQGPSSKQQAASKQASTSSSHGGANGLGPAAAHLLGP